MWGTWPFWGSVAAAGATVVVAVASSILNYRSSKKLQAEQIKATKELEKLKSDATTELEGFKNQLAFSFTRKTKFFDANYTAISEIWLKFSELETALRYFGGEAHSKLKMLLEMKSGESFKMDPVVVSKEMLESKSIKLNEYQKNSVNKL